MSIFDRFVSKETGGQKRKTVFPASTRQRFSELNEAAIEAKEQYPEDGPIIDDLVWAMKEACQARYKQAMDGDMSPMKAEARFFLSKDRLTAYACLLPPEYDGDGISLEEFLGDLHYEGIVYGVLKEEIPSKFARGYLHFFPVARGTPPQPGEDGKVVELFRRRGHMRLEVQNGSQVEFGEADQLQPIRKGTVICLIQPPRPGTDGMDVTGLPLPCPPVVSAYVPQGKNISVDRNGQALTAGVDGLLYMEDERFCIQEHQIIEGDLDNFQGTFQIAGDLYIGGNVDGGVHVKASGDIVINGKVGRAQVTSTSGTIRVQQGVYGVKDQTLLTAASQVQSPVMEWAEIEAGTSVIAETISNCVIYCSGTVYAMTGRGLIVNSQIHAANSILCLRVGNLAGGRSRFSVGYPPRILETRERIKADLAMARSTVERLWPPITELRKKGSRISDREKVLLEQLVQQRDLYLKRQEELNEELRTVNRTLDKKSKGRIRCEKLYPFLEVQIGRLTEEIVSIEEKCNIRVEEDSIHLT